MNNPIIKTVQQKLDVADKKISHATFSRAQKWMPKLRPWLVGLEWSCNGLVWLSFVVISLVLNQEQSTMIPKLLIGLIVDIFYVAIIKALARRRRPVYAHQRDQMIVSSIDKHSFPSGHCSRATYVALFARHYLENSMPLVTFVVNFWCICVCTSRVLLGRHHIFDCIAGGFIGWLNFATQFLSPIPVNGLGMLMIRALFGSKAFNDPNDIEGVDAFE